MKRAILMAAGRGTRISREIYDSCKCTLDIGGIPLIRHTVQMLVNMNIEVHIAVGFNKHLIKESLKGLDVVYHDNVFYSITNSLASLWFAREALSGDTVILGNADVFWEDNLLTALLSEKRDCAMLCDSSRVEQGDYLFNVIDDKIVSYGKGIDCHQANCEYVGLAIIQGALIEKCRERLDVLVEEQRHGDWWELILYSMTAERPIWAKDISGMFWAEIDFIEDYKRILEYRRSKNV